MDLDRIRRIAELIRSGRDKALLSGLPADLEPQSEAEAYAVQDALAAPSDIIGWKVGPGPSVQSYRCAPLVSAARIEAGGTIEAGLTEPEIEAEIALVLGADLPAKEALTAKTVQEAVAAAGLAIEVLGSSFADRKTASDLSSLADLQSNLGVVLGPLRKDWQGLDFSALRPVVTMERGGTITSDKPLASTHDVLQAIAWLAAHAAARGRPLRKGQVIITGARVGPTPIAAGEGVTVSCDDLESVSVRRG